MAVTLTPTCAGVPRKSFPRLRHHGRMVPMRATRLSLVAFAAAGLISAGAFAQSQSQSDQGASGPGSIKLPPRRQETAVARIGGTARHNP